MIVFLVNENNWHQLYLTAAGFLTAILVFWIRHWVDSFTKETDRVIEKKGENIYAEKYLTDRRYSLGIGLSWMLFAILCALIAFFLTLFDSINHLFISECVQKVVGCFILVTFFIIASNVVEQLNIHLNAAWSKKPYEYREQFSGNMRQLWIIFISMTTLGFILISLCINGITNWIAGLLGGTLVLNGIIFYLCKNNRNYRKHFLHIKDNKELFN